MITSVQNPLVKQLKKLRSLKARREQNLCLLEGTNLLEAACETNSPIAIVCCTLTWQARYFRLWEEVFQRAQRTEIVTPEVLEAIATTVSPDGIVAAIPRQRLHSIVPKNLTLGLFLERLQDPGNLGTIVRTSVAAGAEGLWLSADSVEADNPKTLRASTGAWFRLPIEVSADLAQTLSAHRDRGLQIVATAPRSPLTYWEVDWQKPSLILLGNERAGLSEEAIATADLQVSIPLCGGVESLNVSVAAALLLYEARRQRLNL
ncbi:MAG: RNA methyltransferase [Cyanobacteria bacterium SBLK]|nr:RNA methyltransferase [Cyanobacteria bacterium SBLK]